MAEKLILHTTAAASTLDAVTTQIREIGLIENSIDFQGYNHYLAGERFAALITFLGCAPHIVTDPGAGDSFCHVEPFATESSILIGGSQGVPPRCPSCRTKLGEWRNHLQTDEITAETPLNCPKCNSETALASLNWRHYGGFGNLRIDIWGIPAELALPGDELMQRLEETTGSRWSFLYLEE